MARKPQVRYFDSRKAYYTQHRGRQHKLAEGPEDSPHGPTYLAALAAFRSLLEMDGAPTAGAENTARTVMELYLQAMEGRRKPRTYAIQVAACKLFCQHYGEVRCSQLKPWHAEQIISIMRQPRPTPQRPPSQRPAPRRVLSWGDTQAYLFLTHISAAMNWAVRQELIPRNPFGAVEMPRRHSMARQRLVSPEEHERILADLSGSRRQALRRVIIALQGTGARPSEITQARVSDFHPDLKAIVYYRDDVRAAEERGHKGSARKDRVIYLTGETLEMVRQRAATAKPRDLLFPNSRGTAYTGPGLDGCFEGLRDRLGLVDYVPYSYRHTFATNWLLAGRSAEVLAQLLGNSPETLRKHYAHLYARHDAMRAQLEGFMQEAGAKSGSAKNAPPASEADSERAEAG
jgi:integrase